MGKTSDRWAWTRSPRQKALHQGDGAAEIWEPESTYCSFPNCTTTSSNTPPSAKRRCPLLTGWISRRGCAFTISTRNGRFSFAVHLRSREYQLGRPTRGGRRRGQ